MADEHPPEPAEEELAPKPPLDVPEDLGEDEIEDPGEEDVPEEDFMDADQAAADPTVDDAEAPE